MSAPGQDTIKKGEEEGLCLVDWYLDFAERMQPTSWSMEQVNAAPVRATLKDRVKRNKAWIDYKIVEFAKFGVPQTRTRIIAGSPSLIHRIRFGKGMLVAQVATVNDTVNDIPEGATYIRCNWHRETKQEYTEEAQNGEFINERAQKLCRPLDEPAWTVVTHPLQWWDKRYARIRNLNATENLALQTFPATYKPAPKSTVADFLKGIGNAVPPLFACKLMTVS
jgi:site-specific DNA-cytosine methylase